MTFKISNKNKNNLLYVARHSLKSFLKKGEKPKFEFFDTEIMKERAVFVSLWGKNYGELRGCLGHLEPTYPLIDAVAKTAISSAFEDSRFKPLKIEELSKIKIEINVLSSLKKILPEEIEIGKHGIYLIQKSFRGVFLPDVPVSQGWNLNKFLDELSIKAGLKKGDWKNQGTKLLGFETESWIEN